MVDWLQDVFFAHRGMHGPGRPENSIAAIEAAADLGWGVELDVRVLADGTVVVFHDDDFHRMTGVAGAVANATYLRASRLRLKGFGFHTIPKLSTILSLIRGRAPLYVELKPAASPAGALADAVAPLLTRYRGPVLAASFSGLCLQRLASLAPALPRCLIVGPTLPPGPEADAQLRREKSLFDHAKPHAVAAHLTRGDDPWLESLRRRDVSRLAWTVTSRRELAQAETWANGFVMERLFPPPRIHTGPILR